MTRTAELITRPTSNLAGQGLVRGHIVEAASVLNADTLELNLRRRRRSSGHSGLRSIFTHKPSKRVRPAAQLLGRQRAPRRRWAPVHARRTCDDRRSHKPRVTVPTMAWARRGQRCELGTTTSHARGQQFRPNQTRSQLAATGSHSRTSCWTSVSPSARLIALASTIALGRSWARAHRVEPSKAAFCRSFPVRSA